MTVICSNSRFNSWCVSMQGTHVADVATPRRHGKLSRLKWAVSRSYPGNFSQFVFFRRRFLYGPVDDEATLSRIQRVYIAADCAADCDRTADREQCYLLVFRAYSATLCLLVRGEQGCAQLLITIRDVLRETYATIYESHSRCLWLLAMSLTTCTSNASKCS